VAESFGSNAERYDRSRLFQAAGCRVLGVDPDERMAPKNTLLSPACRRGRMFLMRHNMTRPPSCMR